MHYKDGTPARIGDHVVGVGYNRKNADGSLRRIAGTVINLNPTSQTCNIAVSYTEVVSAAEAHRAFGRPALQILGGWAEGKFTGFKYAYPDTEYGQCDQFELVSRDPNQGA